MQISREHLLLQSPEKEVISHLKKTKAIGIIGYQRILESSVKKYYSVSRAIPVKKNKEHMSLSRNGQGTGRIHKNLS